MVRNTNPSYEVLLRWLDKDKKLQTCKLIFNDEERARRLADFWIDTIRARNRWNDDRDAVKKRRLDALSNLKSLGLEQSHLESMSYSRHVEVHLESFSGKIGKSTHSFPWEYVLSAAVAELRIRNQKRNVVVRSLKANDFLVTRFLDKANVHKPEESFKSLLFVQSEPGRLEKIYSFRSERGAIKSLTEDIELPDRSAFTQLKSPSLLELESSIEINRPDIIHFTGVDSQEGTHILQPSIGIDIEDGFFLKDESNRGARAVSYKELPEFVFQNNRQKFPYVVSFNCYFSASRLSPAMIAAGASYAIGFQDVFEDHLAEQFFIEFYAKLMLSHSSVLSSFKNSLQAIQSNGVKLAATGVVLISDRSLIEQTVNNLLDEEAPSVLSLPTIKVLDEQTARKVIDVDVLVVEDINYGMIHNNRSLFEKFTIKTNERGRVENIDVNVKLQIGSNVFPYHQTFSIEKPLDLRHNVRVPLTWEFIKFIRETIRTTIFVEVLVSGTAIHRKTYPVNLQPVNEWKDSEQDGGWLPSFVMPRDPAVQSIVEKAQRNLLVLAGDYFASFDGYQSGDPGIVDLQVEAIWAAIAYDTNIKYIEPPPTYSEHAQRLRTPSEVMKTRQGTCIDLSLLLAACIEYVGIHPVLFLTRGHTCLGYWRDWQAHRAFITTEIPKHEPLVASKAGYAKAKKLRDMKRPSFSYEYKVESFFEQVSEFVSDGKLVALEATIITEKGSFHNAKREGRENIRYSEEFDAMFDIDKARMKKITPLPVIAPH